jgi:hypothetical protein
MKSKINTPYLSGDFFANLAQVQVLSSSINLCETANAKTIFIKGDFLAHHLEHNIEVLRDKVIISGNSDFNHVKRPINVDQLRLLLCQNLIHDDPEKCVTIPIGLENFALAGSGNPSWHRKVARFVIEDKVLVPPMAPSNSIRENAIKEIEKFGNLFDRHLERLPRKNYFELTKKYRFILALEGNGFDTHRLWEILYQGSFPVVLDTPWIRQLQYLNLPIMRLKSLGDLTPCSLIEFTERFKTFDPMKCDVLWSRYWEELVKSVSNSKIRDRE